MIPATLQDKYILRFVICSRLTETQDITFAWQEIKRHTDHIIEHNYLQEELRQPSVNHFETNSNVSNDIEEYNGTHAMKLDKVKKIDINALDQQQDISVKEGGEYEENITSNTNGKNKVSKSSMNLEFDPLNCNAQEEFSKNKAGDIDIKSISNKNNILIQDINECEENEETFYRNGEIMKAITKYNKLYFLPTNVNRCRDNSKKLYLNGRKRLISKDLEVGFIVNEVEIEEDGEIVDVGNGKKIKMEKQNSFDEMIR